LASIRQLANQTAWYGLSNIIGRFINYLLTPLLAGIYASPEFGDISILFALAAFLNIVFTYGMETSYFRFSQKTEESKVFNNTFGLLLITTLILSALIYIPSGSLATMMSLGDQKKFILYVILIVAADTLAVVPFSRLRHQGRPKKFATIKLANILLNISGVVFFLYLCKSDYESNTQSIWASLYDPEIGIGYVFLSQLGASLITLLLLTQEFKGFRFELDRKLIQEIFIYSTPLIVVGFGGMINETIDRFLILLRYSGTALEARSANGIYSANYKLAVLIVVFIQTFRMGAEPFFFKHAQHEKAPETYARIMRLFIIACCFCFLGVVLFLDVWKYFMAVHIHPEYAQGLLIVPILMLAKLFLGIYYNLSIWYKLSDKTMIGAWITIAGAVITVLINYLFIPIWGYWACAFATVCCYGTMMVMSYYWGQKYYPIPYDLKSGALYILFALGLFGLHFILRQNGIDPFYLHLIGSGCLFIFLVTVLKKEKDDLSKLSILKPLYRYL
jgi:O-antigen/teichoic acid export membrane protein